MLGAGADDILMLCARAYAGPGDRISIAYEPTYPVYRVSTWVAGAEVGDDRSCADVRLPAAQSERCARRSARRAPARRRRGVLRVRGGETAVPLLDDDVIVVRTFSKAFGLASARVGYGLAAPNVAADLNARQEPAPVSTLSAALALAALEAGPPDVSATIAERERLAERPALARARAARRPGRTSCWCRTSARRSSRTDCCGAACPCAPHRVRSASPCTGRRRTTGCSRRSRSWSRPRSSRRAPTRRRRAGRRCRRVRRGRASPRRTPSQRPA